ncbi:hypothetical protein PROFUN_13390 [Planoprotostelium fungivorum]|uniref:Uncharacterized protein n=1 Tax=Planoprotostelium fungivorum TaxID=1890364 RepID=A0A2P6MZV0_9EUKA|nr:hypothetical protein PROFUN_13390 [Planoprotostelium fungivorum]
MSSRSSSCGYETVGSRPWSLSITIVVNTTLKFNITVRCLSLLSPHRFEAFEISSDIPVTIHGPFVRWVDSRSRNTRSALLTLRGSHADRSDGTIDVLRNACGDGEKQLFWPRARRFALTRQYKSTQLDRLDSSLRGRSVNLSFTSMYDPPRREESGLRRVHRTRENIILSYFLVLSTLRIIVDTFVVLRDDHRLIYLIPTSATLEEMIGTEMALLRLELRTGGSSLTLEDKIDGDGRVTTIDACFRPGGSSWAEIKARIRG